LGAAMRQLISRFRSLHSIPVRLDLGGLGRLPHSIETVVYRLLQECLSNVARHSSARGVIVSLRRDDRTLRLRVQDDGVGFNIGEALGKQDSYGLAGMRERVVLLGGACEISSRPGRGTAVSIELPIIPPERSRAEPLGAGGPAAGARARRFQPRG